VFILTQVVVSAKIPKRLKDEIDRLGIKVSEVIRRALVEEVMRRKLEAIKERRERIRRVLNRIPDERIVQTIREFREGR